MHPSFRSAMAAALLLAVTASPAAESRMAGLLRQLADRAAPFAHCCLNDRRADALAPQLGVAPSPTLLKSYFQEALRAGRTEEAIRRIREYISLVEEAGAGPDDPWVREAREWLAVAYLRLGEQENCLLHHGSESCLLPIRGGGVHRVERGSRAAVEQLEVLLAQDPENLAHRWLLNLAYMTLGEYPGGVPPALRLPESVFDAGEPFDRFRDVAPSLGVAVTGLSGGVVLDDLDGDDHLDLLVSSWGLLDPLRFFRADGEGGYVEATAAAGLEGEVGGLNLVHADYDGDGDLDVLVLRGAWLGPEGRHPNSLLRNDGGGRFENVTAEAGLLSFRPTQTAAWADYDGDGHLDLFVGNESTGPDDVNRCELFRNRGDGTFDDVAAEVGLDHAGFVKGVAWGDVDDDGRPDLYLSRLGQPNVLYRNEGPAPGGGWRFADVTDAAGVAAPVRSFPTWFWDFDNDGHLDLLVAPFSGFTASSLDAIVAHRLGRTQELDRLHLYRNRGDGTFEEVAAELGIGEPLLAMGAGFGDFDNDGWPDAYFGTGEPALATLVPNRAFRNVGGTRFADVTAASGLGHLQKGHGIAFGDVDGDGDQDLYAVMGGAYSGDVYPNALFRNPGNGNRWVTLVAEGAGGNRSAIGARIRVVVREGGAERSVHALVGGGGSFGSSSLRQEVGLGAAEAIVRVEVRWPGKTEPEVFESVPLERVVRLVEGSGVAEVQRAATARRARTPSPRGGH